MEDVNQQIKEIDEKLSDIEKPSTPKQNGKWSMMPRSIPMCPVYFCGNYPGLTFLHLIFDICRQ